MKNRTLHSCLRIVALLLVLPVFFVCCGFFLPPQYNESFLGGLRLKTERLSGTEGNRIIIIGGSSVAFGTDSAWIEEETGMPVVNFGLYAALGTKVMLELALPDIREGDIVIICPEQQEQTLSDYFSAELTWKALDGCFSLLPRILQDHALEMVSAFPEFSIGKLKSVLTKAGSYSDGVYSIDSFNSVGDIDNPAAAQNIMPGGWDTNMPVSLDRIPEDFCVTLNQFAQEVRAKGADVWFRLCPVNQLALADGTDSDRWYEEISGQLSFPVLGNPSDSILEAGWFYDTNFHLNQAGKEVYTYRLIRALKAELLITAPTASSLPQMPEMASESSDAADPSGYLIIEDQVLTGVTESGRTQTVLAVPSSVRRIADGAFSGCSGLREIRLPWSEPNECSVGQGLLDGTNAVLVVPSGCGAAYRLNYFWSAYSAEIQEENQQY